MKHLSKAKEILGDDGNGYSSGKIDDSEVADKTSLSYKKSLDKYTVTQTLDSSISYSTEQLKILRKKQSIQDRIKQHNSKTIFAPDTDKMLMTKDIPNFKAQITASRNAAYKAMNPFANGQKGPMGPYGAMNPFNVVASHGKRV